MRPRLLLGISILWLPLAFLFDGVTVLVLPLRLGGGAGELGLVSLVGLGIAAALQPVAGVLSDRVRDRVDRRGFVAIAAVPAVLGLWVLVATTGVAAAAVGYVALQVGATAIQAGQQTLIPEHVAAEGRGRASGLKSAFDVGGALVAFVVLGATLASGDLRAAATVSTVVLVAGVLATIALVPGCRGRAVTSRSIRIPPGLGSLVVARFLFLFATYAVGRFLLLLVAERLGMAPDHAADEAGGLLAAFTLVTAGAAVVAGWLADQLHHRALMLGGAIVAAIGIVVLVPPAGLPGLIAGGLLMSGGTAAFVSANWAATTALVPATSAGSLMAIANLGTALAAAAAGLLGPVIEAAGFAPALAVAAAASAAAVVPLGRSMSPAAQPTEVSP